jgi:outer membrane protein assembly factor BamD
MRRLAIILIATWITLSGCSGKNLDKTADWSAEKLYSEAKSALDNGDYEQAINYYETLEARYPFGVYALQAQLDVAYAYYRYEEPESAIAAADRFIKLNPRHPAVDYAYYLKGVADFDRGSSLIDRVFTRDLSAYDTRALKSSYQAFSTLVERFPDSKYAGDARERMIYLRNQLAEAEVDIAQYYLDRKAYVAAAKRAKYVVEHFQGTPVMPKALSIMDQSYRGLGLDTLASDIQRVLEANYGGPQTEGQSP